jgi:hypothetical protein
MGALIVQQLDFPVGVAHQQQRLAAYPGSKKVAGRFDLALVPDIDPCRAEDPVELEAKDVFIAIDASVHSPGLNQRSNLLAGDRSHHPEFLALCARAMNAKKRVYKQTILGSIV